MGTITREQIQKDLFSVIATLAKVNANDLKPGDRLREDLGFDSLKSMEALSRITELYEVDPEFEEVMELQTLDEIIDYMASHLL